MKIKSQTTVTLLDMSVKQLQNYVSRFGSAISDTPKPSLLGRFLRFLRYQK